jgi:hypothetical protein
MKTNRRRWVISLVVEFWMRCAKGDNNMEMWAEPDIDMYYRTADSWWISGKDEDESAVVEIATPRAWGYYDVVGGQFQYAPQRTLTEHYSPDND